MRKLVANHHSNPDFISNAGREWIDKKARLPVGGQTPVFHRASLEVRDGDQICDGEVTEGEMLCGLMGQRRTETVPCFGRG